MQRVEELVGQHRVAARKAVPLERIRWISFGHVEADESGSMNQWLAAAPAAQVTHGATGVLVSLNDLSDRPPEIFADGGRRDIGGHVDDGIAAVAQNRNIQLRSVKATLEGGMDIQGILGIDEKVRNGYLELARREPQRFIVIDGSQGPDATEHLVANAVLARLTAG